MTVCLTASARTPPSQLLVPHHAHYRAIFCGADGTETSLAYSRALSADLARLAAAGLGVAEALARLRREACGEHNGRLLHTPRPATAPHASSYFSNMKSGIFSYLIL